MTGDKISSGARGVLFYLLSVGQVLSSPNCRATPLNSWPKHDPYVAQLALLDVGIAMHSALQRHVHP